MNVYDFDGTVYRGDSTVDFWLFCLRKKLGLVKYIGKQFAADCASSDGENRHGGVKVPVSLLSFLG